MWRPSGDIRDVYKAHDGMAGEPTPGGAPASAAFLRASQIVAEPVRDRLRAWKTALEHRCHRLDIAPDLADDIGSRRWFRGLGTMLGLGCLALAFWPDFSALEAATPLHGAAEVRDEFRSQMILPLMQNGESGRRMAVTAAVVPVASAPERPRVSMVATLGQGDSFARMLQRAGVSPADADRLEAVLGGAVSLDRIAPGTRFDITLGQRAAPGAPRPLQQLAFRARFDLDLTVDRRGDALVLDRRPLATDNTPLRVQGVVGSSLYRSARAAGAPAKAIQEYLQTLGSQISLDSDIAPTDRFDIIVGYKRSASGQAETGDLLYAGLERGGKPLAQLLRWGEGGQFYEASGVGNRQAAGLYSPVAGRMTSGYGMRRHPILGYARMHAGIDFGAAWGAPIHAVSSGAVVYAGRHGGHGNYVRLDHGGGLGTGYAHMSRIAVTPGSHVSAGQVIGYVGSTGLSTGPHLHYELYQNGRTVNPLGVRFAVKAAVDGKEQAAFKARMAQLKAVAPGAALRKLTAPTGKIAFNGD